MTTNDDATLNQFERLMLKENWPGDSDRARTAVRDVADTIRLPGMVRGLQGSLHRR
jgi:hypothetical protein